MKNPIQLSDSITTLPALAYARFRLLGTHAVRRIAFPLLVFAAGLMLVQPCVATPFQWEYTGSLNVFRYDHTATSLRDGKVLVAGGFPFTATAELYDPATGTWTLTGSLHAANEFHTATLLADGKVLVAGGQNSEGFVASSELYDPATGVWTITGSLNVPRFWHTATLLNDGKVLAAGGYDQAESTSAELYDPTTGAWTGTGSLNAGHFNHTATLLADGRVLVAGGNSGGSSPSAELYDPATGSWTVTGSLNIPRSDHTAELLSEGKVLVAGGVSDGMDYLASAELYDPATGTWTATGSLNTGRKNHGTTLLRNGEVLVEGGYDAAGLRKSAELYLPATGIWMVTGSLHEQRAEHTATLLPDGRVLVAGSTLNETAELYDPGIVAAATTVEGRGVIAGQGDTATFNLNAKATDNRPSGSLSFSDPAAGVSFSRGKVRTLTFAGNSATLRGNARMADGTKVTYSVSVTDSSNDGSTDSFSITLSNGYSASGTLTGGDISIQ